jgi:hypothetical protein
MPSFQELASSSLVRAIAGLVVLIVVAVFAYSLGSHSGPSQPTQQVQANMPGPEMNEGTSSQPNNNEQRPIGRMKLEAQFAGPLKSTVIQRWRDDEAGLTCYVYLPILVPHSKPLPNGLVFYGANNIGSISCR